MVPALEERQAVNVVPVQMGEQDVAGEGPPPSRAETRRMPVPASRGGWAATARAGASSSARSPHRTCAPRNERIRLLEPVWIREYRRNGPAPVSIAPGLRAGAPRTTPRDPLARVDRPRRPPPGTGSPPRASTCGRRSSRWARSPRRAPGPYSARCSPSCSTRITPSRTRKTRSPVPPAGEDGCRRGSARSTPCLAPMTRAERDRSSAVSTAVTAPRSPGRPKGCAGRTTGGTSP